MFLYIKICKYLCSNKQIGVIFSHLKLWVAVVRQNLIKYIKIMFQVISKVKTNIKFKNKLMFK